MTPVDQYATKLELLKFNHPRQAKTLPSRPFNQVLDDNLRPTNQRRKKDFEEAVPFTQAKSEAL